MKRLYDDNFNMTEEAKNIQDEFDCLITPFFEKYGPICHPIDFAFMIDSVVNLENTRNYLLNHAINKHNL